MRETRKKEGKPWKQDEHTGIIGICFVHAQSMKTMKHMIKLPETPCTNLLKPSLLASFQSFIPSFPLSFLHSCLHFLFSSPPFPSLSFLNRTESKKSQRKEVLLCNDTVYINIYIYIYILQQRKCMYLGTCVHTRLPKPTSLLYSTWVSHCNVALLLLVDLKGTSVKSVKTTDGNDQTKVWRETGIIYCSHYHTSWFTYLLYISMCSCHFRTQELFNRGKNVKRLLKSDWYGWDGAADFDQAISHILYIDFFSIIWYDIVIYLRGFSFKHVAPENIQAQIFVIYSTSKNPHQKRLTTTTIHYSNLWSLILFQQSYSTKKVLHLRFYIQKT